MPPFWKFHIFLINALFLSLKYEARWRRKYWFLLYETFTFTFYFFEMNRWDIKQSYITILKIPYIFGQLPSLVSNSRPGGGENIDFYYLKLLHTYFTFLRWIDWAIEQSHTTILKIPYIFGKLPFFKAQIWDPVKVKILIFTFWNFYIHILLFEMNRWDIKQSYITILKIPYIFGQLPSLASNSRPGGGENIDFYFLKLLHSYFTFLRWIDEI